MANTEMIVDVVPASALERVANLIGRLEGALAVAAALEGGQTWYTREEAADYLRMDVRTLDRYARMGDLPKYNAAGIRAPRYRKVDLDALMQLDKAELEPPEASDARTD